MSKQFTDSVTDCYALTQELIRGMPRDAQLRARRAAEKFVALWDHSKTEAPRDPAVAVGAAWAVFFMADHIINVADSPIGDSLVQIVGADGRPISR